MAKRITLFNHKANVGRTTVAFHLGWMLALRGKRVLLVDADPQCYLTELVLGRKRFEQFYSEINCQNLYNSLQPAFKAQPRLIEATICQVIPEMPRLFLLPGHLRMAEYVMPLSIAQGLTGSLYSLQNMPGALSYLLDETAKRYKIDYILIDTHPSLDAINQNLLITSDYFLIPTLPDAFSILGIDSLSHMLFQWALWARKAMSMPILIEETTYPLRKVTPKFLGLVVHRYSSYASVTTETGRSFRPWIEQINAVVSDKLVPFLQRHHMAFSTADYQNILGKNNYYLAGIPDLREFLSISQQYSVPVFALSDVQLESGGIGIESYKKRRDGFKTIFSEFVDRLIALIETHETRY